MADQTPTRRVAEKKRNATFAEAVTSKICLEVPCADNPYIAERVIWHGYDVLDLMRKRSLVDVIFLLLKGELPSPIQARQLEHILIALANPGPRHASTRAVMNASVSKTEPVHLLPIGLALLSGESLGATQVHHAIKFFRKNLRHDPLVLGARACEQIAATEHPAGECLEPAPGFGSCYAGIDHYACALAGQLAEAFPENEAIAWGMQFSRALAPVPAGWLMTGVAAAMFVELGFAPNTGAGLFQLAACPGLLAHGIEMSGKPLTAMPFVADENYHYAHSGGQE